VRSSPSEHAAADRCSTHQTGLATPEIDPVFKLEEAADAIRVDII
jgi:hypothetical protein